MQAQVTNRDLYDLLRDGADVLTTVLNFGNAEIKRSTKADLSLLTVSGIYSSSLGKQIEKSALQCRGNVGIEFKDIKVNPEVGKKFDLSVVNLLKTIQDRCVKRNKLFVLCSPPSELLDLLKLTGVYEKYQVFDHLQQADLRQTISAPSPAGSRRETVASFQKVEIQKKILHLNQSLKRTESLEKGLESAERCVKRFLPQQPPQAEGYAFSFSYRSSEKIGGDFFDFIPLDAAHLAISIGDVSGHGIDAALLMGMTKKVIRIRALDTGPKHSPAKVLCKANSDLVGDFPRAAFATALYGVLDLASGTFTYARAGHEPPILTRAERGKCLVRESKGLPLAIDSGRVFDRVLEDVQLTLEHGAFLFLCTDGLAECWNDRGAIFSRKRLQFALEQLDPRVSCQTALDAVFKDLTAFASGRPQEDDMTAILIKRTTT